MYIKHRFFSTFTSKCVTAALAAVTLISAAAGVAFLTRSSPQALTPGETIQIDKGNCTIEGQDRTYTRSEIRNGGVFNWGQTYYEGYHGSYVKNPNYVINFYRHKTDDTYNAPFYCIQNGAHVTDTARTVVDPNADNYWKSLPADAQLGIKLALLYGYRNTGDKLGGKLCDAYVATQVLIWEFAEGCIGLDGNYYSTPQHKHSASMQPDIIDGVQRPQGNSSDWFVKNVLIKNGGDKSNYKTPAYYCHEELVNRVKNATKKPSFDGASITLDYDKTTKTYRGKLNDTGNQLSNYTVKNANGLSVSVSGNELVISSSASLYGTTVDIVLEKNMPAADPSKKVVTLVNGQDQEMITGYEPISVISTVHVTSVPSSGYVRVYKSYKAATSQSLQGAYSVAGAKYGVYGTAACIGTPLATLTVQASGYSNAAEIDGIEGGSKKVWIKELSVPTQRADNFEWSMDGIIEATVTVDNSEDSPVTVNSTDKVTEYGWFRMHKQTEADCLEITEGNSLYSVVGAEYAVYSADGTYKGTYITKTEGLTDVVKVPVGSYYAIETKAPSGHMLRTEQIPFFVNSMSSAAEAILVRSENPAVHDPFNIYVNKDWSEKTQG